MIKTLVADDDAPAREGLRGLLEQEPDVTLVDVCSNGRAALEAIQQHQPDLVFLDVQMPGMTGFDVLRALEPQALPLVIFVTAYDRYALGAFEVHAVDYLLKPFSNRRFREALQRARKSLSEKTVAQLNERLTKVIARLDKRVAEEKKPDPAPYLRRIALKKSERVVLLDVEDIDWIEAADNYVSLHTNQRTHLLRTTLSEMEEKLDPKAFMRIHRSRIVNVNRIKEMHPLGSGDALLVLADGTELVSSRTYSEERRRLLDLP